MRWDGGYVFEVALAGLSHLAGFGRLFEGLQSLLPFGQAVVPIVLGKLLVVDVVVLAVVVGVPRRRGLVVAIVAVVVVVFGAATCCRLPTMAGATSNSTAACR